MSSSFTNKLITNLSDWLFALFGASLLIWFAVTQPVYSTNKALNPLNVDLKKLQRHVKLLIDGYGPRTIEYGNLNNTAAYIYNEFERLGNVEYQNVTTLVGQYKNVVLQLGRNTNEVFIIGAHYDAENDFLDTEGNASGVATLIELARQLSLSSDKLSIQVILVAYPLSNNQVNRDENTGSYYHAAELKASGKKVRLMVSLDSVGHFNESLGSQKHPYKLMQLFYPDKGNYINLNGRLQDFREIRHLKKSFSEASALPLYSQNLPESFGNAQSIDHRNYWRQGFPAVLISDTHKYRNTGSNLKIKERLDYEKMAMLVQGLYQVVMDTVSNIHNTQVAQQKLSKHGGLGLH